MDWVISELSPQQRLVVYEHVIQVSKLGFRSGEWIKVLVISNWENT